MAGWAPECSGFLLQGFDGLAKGNDVPRTHCPDEPVLNLVPCLRFKSGQLRQRESVDVPENPPVDLGESGERLILEILSIAASLEVPLRCCE